MEMEESIFTGIAVVIDDKIGEEPQIDNIISQINKHKMPLLEYKELPELDFIEHFSGISFLILDWKLLSNNTTEEAMQSIRIGGTIAEAYVRKNIDFLKKLMESCFVPIFIFTNESKDDVINKLGENGLYDRDKCNRIFVQAKSELSGRDNKARTLLFKKINEWVEKNSSVYVLKKWEKEYQKAKNKLFNDFFEISPYWPKILWKTFGEDTENESFANESFALVETITRNVYTRMSPFEFSDGILKKRGKRISEGEMRKVLEGEKFVSKEDLHVDLIEPGDIFKKSSGKIYINIRPACDTICRDGSDVVLYVLIGSKLSSKKERKIYNREFGNFDEQHNQAIVMSIQGKTYDFRFKDLKLMNWSDLKDKRIGRLLPPYITRIQQRYALYLQRQGLPRIPIAIIGDEDNATSEDTTGS